MRFSDRVSGFECRVKGVGFTVREREGGRERARERERERETQKTHAAQN